MGSFLWYWKSLIIELHCPLRRPYLQARRHLTCNAGIRALLQGDYDLPSFGSKYSGHWMMDASSDSPIREDCAFASPSDLWSSILRCIFGQSRFERRVFLPFSPLKWIKTAFALPRPSASMVLARFLNSFDGRHAGEMVHASRLCRSVYASPRTPWFCWVSPRNYASEAMKGDSLQSEKVYKVLEGAAQLGYQQMDAALQSLDLNWDSSLVRKVLQRLKDPKVAFNFFVWIVEQKGFRPTTVEYNAVLEILGSAGMFPAVHMLLQRMDDTKCKPLTSTFTILIKYYGKAGMVDEACKTLADMKKYGVEPNVQTYNNLLNTFVRAGNIELAQGIYEQMLSAGFSPNEYTINFLTDGLCTAGRLEEAHKFVSEASVTNVFVYNVLLKGFCKVGKVDEGYKLLDEMAAKGCSPDVYTYNTLIVGSCKAGQLDMALKLRREMVEKGIAPDLITYGTLVAFLCKAKREEEAFLLLACMTSEGFVLSAKEQGSLRKAFSKTSRKVSATVLLKEMMKGS